jgi:NADH:ubiquinone oxidoreductase subunit C
MNKIYEPVEKFTLIAAKDLIDIATKKRQQGKRLLQIFANYTGEHYEIIYSFDEGEYNIEYVKVEAYKDEVVPSIGEIYPYATPYENEAVELFGVKINVITDGYKHKLYKISDDTPYVSDFEK